MPGHQGQETVLCCQTSDNILRAHLQLLIFIIFNIFIFLSVCLNLPGSNITNPENIPTVSTRLPHGCMLDAGDRHVFWVSVTSIWCKSRVSLMTQILCKLCSQIVLKQTFLVKSLLISHEIPANVANIFLFANLLPKLDN